MKRKVKKLIYEFIKRDGITVSIAAMVILCVCIDIALSEKQGITIIDWTIFTTIISALILNSISGVLKKFLMNWLEDFTKLTDDYEKLSSKYTNKMIVYDNCGASQENLKKLQKLKKSDKKRVQLPVICDYKLNGCQIKIKDSTTRYEIPDTIKDYFEQLFAAHGTSKVYNQLTIRVDNWKYKNGKFVIKTSRTTYFNSLVTNRAMDFRLKNGLTLREQFEYGPFLHTLKESSLSNHIGFNGFIESSDGYIVFVKRGNKLSIGKGTYGNSIGASLKTKYALNEVKKFTEEGLKKGISHEIQNELKIPKEELEELFLDKHLIAAYRDIVEGGKPQLLFYLRSRWPKDRIEKNFLYTIKKSDKNLFLEDGKKLLWIPRKELDQICIWSDMIIYQGKVYRMVPSATASIVMLLEYLQEK